MHLSLLPTSRNSCFEKLANSIPNDLTVYLHPSVYLTFRWKYFPELSGVNLLTPQVSGHSLVMYLTQPGRTKNRQTVFILKMIKIHRNDSDRPESRTITAAIFKKSLNPVAGFCRPETGNEVDNRHSQPVSRLCSRTIFHSLTWHGHVAVSSKYSKAAFVQEEISCHTASISSTESIEVVVRTWCLREKIFKRA